MNFIDIISDLQKKIKFYQSYSNIKVTNTCLVFIFIFICGHEDEKDETVMYGFGIAMVALE